MALGGSSLGTLTLYINADTSDFDQAISQVEQRTRSFGSRFSQVERGLDLTPTVDDSQLTALNKHLDVKQRHFAQVGKFMQATPLQPKVNTSDLQDLQNELRETTRLQQQLSRQLDQSPINVPRVTIAPRISNRTINEAPRINTRLSGNVSPKVTVSNRVQRGFQGNTNAARTAAVQPQPLLPPSPDQQPVGLLSPSPQLDTDSIEKYTKRIAELEEKVDSLNEKSKIAAKQPGASTALLDATAKALPVATEKVADGIGTGISQGLSTAIPVFAGKMGDAAAGAIARAAAKAITPAVEFKFQTNFTDIVRAGKELTDDRRGGGGRQSNPSLLDRVIGGVFTGIGQSVGGRIGTGIVSGIENKLDIKFREAAESAVVVLGDGIEDKLGFQFKSVGAFVREKAPGVFDNTTTKKNSNRVTEPSQPPTNIESAITYLASQDDGAQKRDGKGFNKRDTQKGQEFANKIKAGHKLTQEEAKAALQMLQKYRKQLAEAQQGSLPEWDKIANQYDSPSGEKQQLAAQIQELQQQLENARNATPEQVEEQVANIQKAEAELESLLATKRKDLADAMMSAREITLTVLKPIGRELGLPNINKSRKDGGYSKEQLVKEIVSKSDPDELRRRIPFIPVPVSQDVVAESESRATLSPDKLKDTLASKRRAIMAAIARNPGQKTGAELADINNVIQKEYQIINNLLSRDLSNTAKRYLKKQQKELSNLSGKLVDETMGTAASSQSSQPQSQQTEEIPDPWIDVDQMRSDAAATRSAFEIIGDAIGAFASGIGEFASQIASAFQKILGSLGGFFGGGNPFAQQNTPRSPEPVVTDPNAYKPIDVRDGLPVGVDVKEKEKKREYEFKTKSGKTVKVTLKDEGKQESEVSFAIDGSFGNKQDLSQKERDAASLKIFKILKHDAKTRADGYKYRGVAYDLDGYGAARSHAYERLGNFTRPLRGVVGMPQYATTRQGKVQPDTERLNFEERNMSQELIRRNIAKAEARMRQEREQQKSRTNNKGSVDQLRSQAAEAKTVLEILSEAIASFVRNIQEFVSKIADFGKGLFNNNNNTTQASNNESSNPAQQAYQAAQQILENQAKQAQQLINNYTSKEQKQQKVKEVADAIKEKNQTVDRGVSIGGEHEYETFLSAGFSGMGGYNPEVYEKLTNAFGSKHSVTPVFNTDYDTDATVFENLPVFLSSAARNIAQAGGEGVNPVAKQMADQAYQAWLRDPSKKIRFAGYSAGAHAASDALEIFKQLAPDADAKAIGIGGAPFDYRRSNLSRDDYQNVLRKDDQLLRQFAGVFGMNGQYEKLVNPSEDKGIVGAFDAHLIDGYTKDNATVEALKQALEGSRNTEPEDKYGDVLAKITQQAAIRSGISVSKNQIPKLEFNDEHLKRIGARAQYNTKENKLIVSSDVKRFFDALKSGSVNLNRYEQEIKDVVHEIRHAFQYDFGKLNQGNLMSGTRPAFMTPFASTSNSAQRYGQHEASSDYYSQHAKQLRNPQAFLDVIRDTEADAENFAEQWKEIVAGAFDTAEFPEISQRRSVSGAVGANPDLKNSLDSALEAFNQTFDVLKGFQSTIGGSASSAAGSLDDMINSVRRTIEDIEAEINSSVVQVDQQGSEQAVEALDRLGNQLDVEIENVEKFIGYVRRKTGGRADPALDQVQAGFRSRANAVQQNISTARNNAAIRAGLVQPEVAPVPSQLNTWQKVLKNIREEIEAINSGEDIKVRFAKGAASDLGIQLSDEQAAHVVGESGNALGAINRVKQVPGLIQAAQKGNWKDIFEELLDEIDEFTDVALDRFADFVEGIPGGNVFAKIIRGAKEFKGVIFGFVGLQMAWQGLVQVKQWLDSFDEVFVDAAVGWEKFEKLIGFSSKTFNQAQSNIKFVRDEAIRLRTDLKQSMQGFSQLSAAAIDTGLEGTGTKQIFKGINQAGSAYGLDAEGQNRVYTAVSQMISKGSVSSEELKQQLGEVLPGSFQMAARAAGKTTQEFTQLLETGQVLAEDFLPKFAQQLSAETAAGVAGAASSAQGATNRLNNSLLELQVSLGKFGMDERNIVLNAMASMMDFAAKNAVVLSYAMGSLLAGALITCGQALWIFVKRLVVAGANFLMTRLGITSLGLSIKTLGATIRAAASSFLILTVVMESIAMISAAMKDSSGKSRDFANTMKGAFKETQRSIAEAREELEKFNAEQSKKSGQKGTGKTIKEGQDSIIDEAPLLNWVLKKDLQDNSGWFDKLRFRARQTIAGAANGLGTILNPGAVAESVRTGDRTLMPTYANKKFQDTKRATTEILDISKKTTETSTAALNDKEMLAVKGYDEQLRQIQIKRRGIVQMNPGDKKGLNELKKQEEVILAERERAYKPLAAMQSTNQISIQALESEIAVYKEKIQEAETALTTAATPSDKKDIQARLDYYKQTLPQLEDSLKGVQDAQDNLSKSIGESVNKFVLLQKQLQNVADRLADANDSIQMIGNDAKSQLSQSVVRGDVTSGQADFAKGKFDQGILQEQLNRKKGAINEYQALLYGSGAQAILESRGIKDVKDVGAAQLGTLASKAKDGTPEKEVFTRLQEMKKLELESSELTAQLEAAKEQTAQQIRDANKQINDYFRDIGRQSAELALTTKEAQAQIALQQQKNKLKSALQGFQDNFFSSFVDSIIEGMDSLNEPLQASIEREREFQSAQYAREDRDRQGADLYKSLPLDTQNIKLDFSAIDSAPVKELQNSLQESAKASKSLTDQSTNTGAALGTSAKQADVLEANVAGAQGKAKDVATAVQAGKGALSDSAQEAGNLKDNLEGVADKTEGVRESTDGVTSALQNNINAAQNVNTELANNQVSIEGNQTAVSGVNDAITVQAQKILESTIATEDATTTTNILQSTWAAVTAGVVDTANKTWEWFKGLGQNVPFLKQFGDMIADWGKGIQDLIAKTWEWIEGLGKNIPFLQQIGQTVGGWGQSIGGMVQQGVEAVQGALGLSSTSGKVTEQYRTGTLAAQEYGAPRPGRQHAGQDIDVSGNQQAQSFIGGVVTRVVIDRDGAGYGSYVDVYNKALGVVERIAEVLDVNVKEGQTIAPGQAIGGGESHTGVFHYEIRKPVDAQGRGGYGFEGTEDPIKFYEKLGIAKRQGNEIKILSGLNAGQTLNAKEHHVGDGHNHFGEEDAKKANQAMAQGASAAGGLGQNLVAAMSRTIANTGGGGIGRIPRGGFIGSAEQVKSDTPGAQALVAAAGRLGLKPAEFVALMSWESGGTLNPNVQGGDGGEYKGLIQFSPDNQAKYGVGAQQSLAQQVPAIEQYLKDRGFKPGQHDIRHAYSAVLAGNASERYWDSSDSNGTTVRNAAPKFQQGDHYNRAVQFLRDSGVDPNAAGGAVAVGAGQMMPQAAPVAPRPMIAPVPFASMQRQMSVSGTSVDVSKLSAAEQKSAEIQRKQQQQAIEKEKARVEEAKVQGEQRQRQRLEQLRQSLRETEQDRIQSGRQFRDLGLDIGEQTPEREAARKKMGINDTYDDLEKEIAEKVRKTTAARDQASATLQKLSAPDYVPQPGQNVAKDIEGTKAAIAAAEKYLGDLNKIQGELKGQRENRLKFEEEQAAREKKLREQQEQFATEEVSISVLEAEAQRLKDMQSRGVRDQGVENLPKIEATIAARREELTLKQKLTEIDENLRKNKDNPAIVSELNKQKTGLQERLGIVKKTIDANRTYSEQVMQRENAQRNREAANAQAQAELEVQKQKLAGLQELGRLNPNAEGVDQIPKLEEAIALKELELKLTNDLAAADQERFENKIDPKQYADRVKAIYDENKLAKENIYLKRRQAEAEAAIARKRTAFENKSQSAELQGQITEALVRNIELGRRKGDPIAMRFDTQKQQQELNFEKQMLDLEELEMSGKRTKEEINALRKAYTELNEISLENLRAEQQRATEDRLMEISGRFTQSRGAVLGGRADLLGALGLETQAKEFRRVAAIKDQQQSYGQQSLELERFIQQMGLGAEKALELRTNLSEVNNMKLEQINAEFSTMNELMVGVQGSFESAFTSILDGSKSIGEAALDFLKGVGNQLAQMASKMITDEIFGKLFKRGNKDDAKKEAEAIGEGGVLGSLMGDKNNPLAQYNMMNPLPVVMTNAGALGGLGQMGGFGSGGSFIDGIFGGQGGFFGENLFGNSPLPVNMVQANDSIFSSLTNGIMGIFGGGGASGGGLGGLLGGALSLLGGGGSSGGGMGGGLGFLSAIPNLFGFASGGEIGKDGKPLEASVEAALARESAMSGRKSFLIAASQGEIVVPNRVADKLSMEQKAFLIGKSAPPKNVPMNFAAGGIVGQASGGISNTVQNMNGSTTIGGSTVNVNGEGSGSMSPQEARAMQAAIDQRVHQIVEKMTRPRGKLYR